MSCGLGIGHEFHAEFASSAERQLLGVLSLGANVRDGSASTRRERDFEGDELMLKMSGMEAAARCMKSRPSAVVRPGKRKNSRRLGADVQVRPPSGRFQRDR